MLRFVGRKRQVMPQPLCLLKESVQISTQKWKLRESHWLRLSAVINNPLPAASLWLVVMCRHLASECASLQPP